MLPLPSTLQTIEITIRKGKSIREKVFIGCNTAIWRNWECAPWGIPRYLQSEPAACRARKDMPAPLATDGCTNEVLSSDHHCTVPFALVTTMPLLGHQHQYSFCGLGGDGFRERHKQASWIVAALVATSGSRTCASVQSAVIVTLLPQGVQSTRNNWS